MERVEWSRRPDTRAGWLRSVIAGSCAPSADTQVGGHWPPAGLIRCAPALCSCVRRDGRRCGAAQGPGGLRDGVTECCEELNTYAQVRLDLRGLDAARCRLPWSTEWTICIRSTSNIAWIDCLIATSVPADFPRQRIRSRRDSQVLWAIRGSVVGLPCGPARQRRRQSREPEENHNGRRWPKMFSMQQLSDQHYRERLAMAEQRRPGRQERTRRHTSRPRQRVARRLAVGARAVVRLWTPAGS